MSDLIERNGKDAKIIRFMILLAVVSLVVIFFLVPKGKKIENSKRRVEKTTNEVVIHLGGCYVNVNGINMALAATKRCGDFCFVAFVGLQKRDWLFAWEVGNVIALENIEITITDITQKELRLKWAPI